MCRVEFGLCNCIIKFKFNESFYGGSLMELGRLPGAIVGFRSLEQCHMNRILLMNVDFVVEVFFSGL